jgi:hypothetical protein
MMRIEGSSMPRLVSLAAVSTLEESRFKVSVDLMIELWRAGAG